MKTFFSFLIVLRLASVVSAQQTTTVITVNGARPLCEAIMKLEKASGQPITYEDAPYAYAGDLVADLDSRARPGAKVPKGVSLSFPFMPSEVADRTGTAKVLQRLVTIFNRSYPDGAQFTVLDQDGLFHVVPKSARVASGAVVTYTSPLDVPLTVVERDVTGEVALKAILAAIKATTGTTVLIGFSPINGLKRTTVSISNDRATGRTLLTQLLQVVGPSSPLAWQMLTGAEPGYFISIGSWVNQ